jgi:hypothetical protein
MAALAASTLLFAFSGSSPWLFAARLVQARRTPSLGRSVLR